jgi:methyl-accepting chemotaxis protein
VQLIDLVLAPVRVPLRLVRALDDLGSLAERARREPDPVEEVRDRLDLVAVELAQVIDVARAVAGGGSELARVAAGLHASVVELIDAARALGAVAEALDATGRRVSDGGEDLAVVARRLSGQTSELIDGGSDLTAVSERIAADLGAFRAVLPQVMEGLETVDRLEGEVETVAETIEPLQGAAERVGRVTKRLSRTP